MNNDRFGPLLITFLQVSSGLTRISTKNTACLCISNPVTDACWRFFLTSLYSLHLNTLINFFWVDKTRQHLNYNHKQIQHTHTQTHNSSASLVLTDSQIVNTKTWILSDANSVIVITTSSM